MLKFAHLCCLYIFKNLNLGFCSWSFQHESFPTRRTHWGNNNCFLMICKNCINFLSCLRMNFFVSFLRLNFFVYISENLLKVFHWIIINYALPLVSILLPSVIILEGRKGGVPCLFFEIQTAFWLPLLKNSPFFS